MPSSNTSSIEAASSTNRKYALKKIGKGLVKMMLPFAAVHALNRPAQAQFKKLETGRALNFILQIEFMQHAFYVKAMNTPGLIDAKYRNIFNHMKKHQWEHLIHIKNKLTALDVEAAPQLYFDFSASGRLNPFEDFENFLGLAQIFEDLGVGVYKSQIEIIHLNEAYRELLQMVCRAHGVESRHACFIRELRTRLGLADIKGWISDDDKGNLPDLVRNIYVKEDQLNQATIDLSSVSTINTQALREAWDEPIGRNIAQDVMKFFV